MTRFRRLATIGLLSGVVTLALPMTAYAGGSSTNTYVLTENASYVCFGPCATATYFVAKGNATAPGLGHVHEAAFGTVLGFNDDFSCLNQSEDWVLAMPGGLLFFQTTSDTFCFTEDTNVNLEHGDFTVTGGTGRFAHATGGGSFDETVLTSPQVATGTITLTVTT